MTSPILLKTSMAVVVYGSMLWAGYQRRRTTWTVQSWWRFGSLFAAGMVAMAIAMRMARGVDEGVYASMTPFAGRIYFYTMFALLFGGVLGSCALVLWFAKGDPNRQLGLLGRTRSDRSGTAI